MTGSKRGVTQARFPGVAQIVVMGSGVASDSPRDSADLADRTPVLQSTAFGTGRDKLFIRGIADSSFAGPTQATVGNYFGDTRLTYSGADPALRLVDMQQIEILEGPQGTLYGAGAIGGIIRLVPAAPDATKTGGFVAADVAGTQGGHASDELSAAVNLPVVHGVAALRLVGYQAHDGGYIDDPLLGRRSINDSNVDGGRAALHVAPDGDWSFDLIGLGQSIRTANPQYALRGAGNLVEQAMLAQPYRDWIALGSATVRRTRDAGLNLLATIGGVRRDTQLRYDDTHAGGPPTAYDERTASALVDGEIRIWQTMPSGSGWLVGVSADENRVASRRQLGPPALQRPISGVDNRALDLAAFGEGTLALSPAFAITAGGRVTHARIDGEPLAARPQSPFVRGIAHTRFDPTLGMSYKMTSKLTWYARYAQGFRGGGLAVAAGAGRTATYEPDTILVAETGIRADGLFGGLISGMIGISRAWWRDVQADLVGRNGFPYTANIGDGRVNALETQLVVRPTARLRLEANGLFATTRLIHPTPGFERDGGNALPDTPKASVYATLSWAPPVDATQRLRVAFSVRRQGGSRLGAGALFGFDQQGYTEADVVASVTAGRRAYALRIDNLADAKGDRFALGNPFELRDRNQYTPLRPRTVKLSVSQAF